jgi:hypothetical protein
VAEAPPRVRWRETVQQAALVRRRTLAIRHVSGHRLVAFLEVVSPANKDRARHVEDFAAKAVDALDLGVHVLVVDLFPPGPHDPYGRALFPKAGRRGTLMAFLRCSVEAEFMIATSEAAILSRIIEPDKPVLPKGVAQMILQWHFSPADEERMHALLEKAKAGTLTAEEKAAAESYERVGHVVSMLKAKAQASLGGFPRTSPS